MPTSYTSLLGLALPVTGELSGTWGATVNNYITEYIDAAVAGTQTISGSQTAVTLSKTTGTSLSQAGSGSTGSSQYQIINCTGNPAGLLTITAPAASRAYLILNNTSTSQSVKIVGAGPTTGVTVASARCALVAWNGSDFELVASTDITTLSGILGVANGGTGLSSGTSGGVLYYSGTNTLASSAALAANALVVGGGAGVAPSTVTTGTGVVTALGVNTGTAGSFVVNGGALGTPASGTLTNATGLPISTGVSGLGTDVATALAVNVGSSGAVVVNGGALGTPSSGTVTNLTGTASININGTVGATTPNTGVFTSVTSRVAATQDAVIVVGRAGGTSSYTISLTPTTLTASRTLTLPDATDTLVGRATTDTLTNKTLTAPVISTIVNTGTLTLPTSTDTLVGRATTDTLTNKTIQAGTFTNGYTEEVNTANTGTTYTVSLADGTVQILTLTGNCTFTFPTPTAGQSFMLLLKQDGTGGRTVTWPGTVEWPGGVAPTITSAASKLDKYVFTADGSNWYGSNAGQNYTV